MDAAHPAARHHLEGPTSQIRLLRLSPSTSEAISCTLSVWSLDAAPSYEAISYRWGDPTAKRNVFIDGALHRCGQNCWYALWQARHHAHCEYIWIDAICISQVDLDEKSAQVGIMAQIYARSQRVLVSLGDASDEDRFLIETFYSMDEECSLVLNRRCPRGDWIYRLGEVRRSRFMEALRGLGSKPYFSRVWIVQELYMAPARLLMCGIMKIDLDVVYRFTREFGMWSDGVRDQADDIPERLTDDLPSWTLIEKFFADTNRGDGQPMFVLLGKIEDRSEPLATQKARGSVLDVLARFERWQCYDCRDRVYGLLALVVDCKRQLQPDYRKSAYEVALDVLDGGPTHDWDTLKLAVLLFRLLRLNQSAEIASITRTRLGDPPETSYASAPASHASELVVKVKQYFTIWRKGTSGLVATAKSYDHNAVPNLTSEWGVPSAGLAKPSASGNKEPQPVSTAEGSFALVCADAQPGDRVFLFEEDLDNKRPKVGLVIRKRTFRHFTIVGYAVVCAAFHSCHQQYSTAKCGFSELPHERADEVFKVLFDAEDLLVFASYKLALDQNIVQLVSWYRTLFGTSPVQSKTSSSVGYTGKWWGDHGFQTHGSTVYIRTPPYSQILA